MTGRDPVRIALLYPELLGTYGDGGNAAVLASRLAWRSIGAQVVEVAVDEAVPTTADVYLLGGGEDGPQGLAAAELRRQGALATAVDRGAVVLAVCAGFQLLGETFAGPDGRDVAGLGLLDASTRRGHGPRRVGEIVVEPRRELALPVLTGYENHAGVTALGPGVAPLGQVRVGRGNDVRPVGTSGEATPPATEGAFRGRIVGTYLHGPVLARNPSLADLLLSWVVGPLPALDDAEVDDLRAERLTAASRSPTAAGARRRVAAVAERAFRSLSQR